MVEKIPFIRIADAPAPDPTAAETRIEVSAEMLEAGASVVYSRMRDYEVGGIDAESLVAEIYRAMYAVAPLEAPMPDLEI